MSLSKLILTGKYFLYFNASESINLFLINFFSIAFIIHFPFKNDTKKKQCHAKDKIKIELRDFYQFNESNIIRFAYF